jgi:CubicO group peptidase (beta-lactamase class C family)
MVRSLSLTCCLALGVTAHVFAQQLDVAAIDRVFEAYTRPNTPGCVLGIGRGSQVLYERGYGMANLEYDAPLTASTIVEIGSVSKQFTAGAVLLLAQRGVLSLEDDIRKWLPEVPDFGKKITIRMLANHTSGLRDQWGLLGLMNSPPGSAVHTPELVLDLVTRQRDLNFKPNEQYLYSNTNYTLLGIIVRRASGKSLAEFSRENIFGPLGMKDTQWRDDYARVVKGRATAYSRASNDQYRQEMPFTNVYGNGGLLTTVRDAITWWDALYSDKLGVGLLAQLTTSGVLDSQHKIGYALGVSNGTYRGVRTFTHSGATAGYRAYLASYPDTKTTIAVFCNNATANTAQHVERIADLVLATQLAPPATGTAVKAATDVDLNGFAGLYRDPNTEETYRFTVRDGRLTTGTIELVPTSPTTFQDVRRDAVVTVSRERGSLKLRTPASDVPYIELVQIPEATPTAAQLQAYAGTYSSGELGIVYQVIAGDGNLLVKRRLQSDLTLVPTYADAFSNFGSWVFTRASSGKVNGLLYSQGRVRRVRFDKVNDSRP